MAGISLLLTTLAAFLVASSCVSADRHPQQVRPADLDSLNYLPSNGNVEAPAKMEGLYITPCFQTGSSSSFAQTRWYHTDDFGYEIDTTSYTGDPDCTPNESDVSFKMNLRGEITNHGPVRPNDPVQLAEMNWTKATLFVSELGAGTISALQSQCPCGGKWEVGVPRTVEFGDCKEEQDKNFTFKLCNIVTGKTEYFTWQEYGDANHYITSRDCFKTEKECYSVQPNKGLIREKVEETGNTDPASCDYKLFAQCRDGISRALDNCESCYGLECDGCIFRELNPIWPEPVPNRTDFFNWSHCCPCIHFEAERTAKSWATVMC